MSYTVELTGTVWSHEMDIPSSIDRAKYLEALEILGLRGLRIHTVMLKPTSIEVTRHARTPDGVAMVHNGVLLTESHSIPVTPNLPVSD